MDEFTKQKVADLKKAVKSLQDQARNIKKNDNTHGLIEVRMHCCSSCSFCDPCASDQSCDMAITGAPSPLLQSHLQEAKQIGDSFLALEKYVNLNYLVGGCTVGDMPMAASAGQG